MLCNVTTLNCFSKYSNAFTHQVIEDKSLFISQWRNSLLQKLFRTHKTLEGADKNNVIVQVSYNKKNLKNSK